MSAFKIDGNRLVWRGDGETLVVEPWGADSVRVRSSLGHDVVDTAFALLPPGEVDAAVVVDGRTATLTNGALVVVAEADQSFDVQARYAVATCRLEFRKADGTLLFREHRDGGSLKLKARGFQPLAGGAHRITAMFEADPDEKLYGMGQYQQAVLDLKGNTFELAHRNSQASVPFVMSSAGYGFFWHNPAIGRATFARNRTEWVAEATEQLDYWVTVGDRPSDISAAYADATGHAPTMPEYGLGYWQCKLRYWNQEQLLEVAREHKRRGLPLDVIVADFFHWPKMGDYRFDEEFWPDPEGMIAELKELGVELMVSIWPQVSVLSENFEMLSSENALVRTERGQFIQMAFEEPSMFVDFTNPATRETIWEICRRNYHDKGVRLFWLDEAEPEYAVYDFDNYRYNAGPNLQVGNMYPQTYSRAFYDGMVAAGQDEVVNLVRCAWAGSQRYGALAWSGDIPSTFDALRAQIVAGLHMGIAGIPWFTTDIGGFHYGDIGDEEFRELLVRWFQFGTFCPVMRMHGARAPMEPVVAADGVERCESGAASELWSFGQDVYEILARLVHLREAMRPYTRRLMTEASTDGQPVMRAMFHEFPGDTQAWDLADQYMFGPDLLVAPVTSHGARRRRVYLPAGARWTDLRDGAVHEGGQWVEAEAPIDSIPVYARDGALVELVGSI